MQIIQKFEQRLIITLKQIEGKQPSISGQSNCIRIVLHGGKEYWGTVKDVGSDSFAINVSYAGGGRENIVIRINEVASFSE